MERGFQVFFHLMIQEDILQSCLTKSTFENSKFRKVFNELLLLTELNWTLTLCRSGYSNHIYD